MPTRVKTSIKKRRYRLLFRTAATFTQPTTAAEWTTFLATFTELGYARDKSIKFECKRADSEVVDEGDKVYLDYNGKVEAIGLQSAITDYTALEAIEGVDQDLLFVDDVTNRAIFVGEIAPYFDEEATGGETETINLLAEKEGLASKSAFRTRFDIPTS